jgi:hypothetical protein
VAWARRSCRSRACQPARFAALGGSSVLVDESRAGGAAMTWCGGLDRRLVSLVVGCSLAEASVGGTIAAPISGPKLNQQVSTISGEAQYQDRLISPQVNGRDRVSGTHMSRENRRDNNEGLHHHWPA